MSADWAAVRFPDGEVRWTMYNVLSEVVPALSPDFHAVVAAWHAWGGDASPVGPTERVEIYSNYASGFWWRGRATRNRLLYGWDPETRPYGLHNTNRGRPRWVSRALAVLGMCDIGIVAVQLPDGSIRWTMEHGDTGWQVVMRLSPLASRRDRCVHGLGRGTRADRPDS